MPIISVNSYPPTAQSFENHWSAVNASRPTAPIVLPDGTTLASFSAAVATMNASFASLVPATATERVASATLRLKRSVLQPRLVQFGQAVRLYLNRTRFANAAPAAPGVSDGLLSFQSAGRNVAARWAEINAATDLAPFSPPLTLPDFEPTGNGIYTLAEFEVELTALLEAFAADAKATGSSAQERANRNALLPPIYASLKAYRETVLLLLPKNSPFRATLPRLTPAPGTTPNAVVVTGAWDNQLGEARLTWLAAKGHDIEKLQVRGCTGSSYKAEDEEIVADLDLSETHWAGDWGLTAPGALVCFKVYVMTTTGNENGGKAVKIVRPQT